ncbi:hypothetical protein [Duganella sp. BuS-21]|uniref:hypothetical protein n=1 Tax=Duganella sp. BuS-21 TaxID=2943848 RepID=UPI0035A6497E
MTKAAAPAVEAPAAVTTPAVQNKPYIIKYMDYSAAALAQAAVHIRSGYVFSPDIDPEFFPATGQLAVTLVLGTPDQTAVQKATNSTTDAIAMQQAAHDREVEAAAHKLMADIQRDAAKAKLDAEIEEQTKALRKLKDQAAKIV